MCLTVTVNELAFQCHMLSIDPTIRNVRLREETYIVQFVVRRLISNPDLTLDLISKVAA